MTSLMRRNKFNVAIEDGTSDKDRKDTLKKIRSLKGVFNAKALFPGDKDPVLKNMFIVTIDDSKIHPEDVRVVIEKMDHVKYAEYPALRRPMRG